ncbi:MAG: amino acid ABC transporter substrate-binding protein [Gammaproteobacteria bacterium]|nr:amino acid ABC transporter substrate-binding protein [Gammaproteobacteria bacterium]
MKFITVFTLTCATIIYSISAFADHHVNTVSQIKETGKIRIGYRQSEPPMSFVNKDGNPVGYSIDLCNYIVEELKNDLKSPNIKIEYIPVDAKDRFSAITENKIDILCGSTTKTLSRSKLVDFTQLTFITGASLMTLKGQEFNDLAQLDDNKVGVVQNTTTLEHLEKLLKQSYSLANVEQYKSAEQGLDALRNGDIAAFAADQVVLIGLAISSPDGDKFSISPNVFSYEPLALATRRNDAEFIYIANSSISKLSRNKQIFKLYGKWFSKFSEKRPPLIESLYKLNAIPE